MPWKEEVEMANPVDGLKSTRSMFGLQHPNFETLDARIASALKKVMKSSNFKKKVHLEEQRAQKEDRGRHIAFVIYACFRVPRTHETILDF